MNTPMAKIPSHVSSWLDTLSKGEFGSNNVFGSGEQSFEVFDPGTASRLASLPVSSSGSVKQAIASARESFEAGAWKNASPDHREKVMLNLATLVERDFDFLALVEALDTGKPLAEAKLDIQEVATVIRYYAGWANKVSGQTIASAPEVAAITIKGPVGVCAAITPWNYPLPILMYKLAPALAFGNSFVAKPSELAPLSAVYFVGLCEEAGVPSGVVNLLLGGAQTGSDLVSSPGLDKIAFTGSSKTGQAIMAAAASNTTRVSLELGGKSPQVVFASCDIDKAVEGVALGIWTNAGQVCVAGSRLIIEKSLKQEFLDKLVKVADAYFVGHSLDEKSSMGPIISGPQLEKISSALSKAQGDGAIMHSLGTISDSSGHFMKPTIVEGLPHEHPLHQEEIFGPVLAVSTFDNEAEAIDLANATRYGLAAGVWTQRAAQAQRVARGIDAGTVWINTYGAFHPTLPFGGTKSSGFGRELGEAAVDAYTETKTIVEDISEPEGS